MTDAALSVARVRSRWRATAGTPRAFWIAGAAVLALSITVQPFRGDSDVWWHMALGRAIVEHGIPVHEPFSFLAAGNPWTDQAWLYEVLLYRLAAWGGDGLASVFMGCVAVAALVVAALAVPRKASVPGPLIAGAMLLSALVMGEVVGVRSQVFSLLGAATVLLVITRWREGSRRALWVLPPLFLLWANLHAGFIIGFALLAIACAFASPLMPASRVHRGPLLVAALASVLATFVNPAGPALYGYVGETFLNPTLTSAITEWLSPDFHNMWLRLFELEAVLMVLLWALGGGPRGLDVILGGAAVAATLQAQRNVSLFAVIAVPQLATYGALVWRARITPLLQRRGLRAPAPLHPLVAAGAVVVVAAATALGAVVPNTSSASVAASEAQQYPTAAADYIATHLQGHRLYSPDIWGGYLAARFPQNRVVFLYGETAVFGDADLQLYEDIHLLRPDWSAVLTVQRMRDAVIPLHSQEASAFHALGWGIDCYDATSGAVVMSAPVGEPAPTRAPVLQASTAAPHC